jgi:hypothetical protein
MKTILLIVFFAASTSVVKAEWVDPPSEAERLAKYHATINQQYNTAKQEIQPSAIGNLPIGTALSAGALAYSLRDLDTSNPSHVGTAVGAASSMLPHVSNWTSSSALRSLGWR